MIISVSRMKTNTHGGNGHCSDKHTGRRSRARIRTVGGVIAVSFCYLLILLSIVRCSESSLAPTSSTSKKATAAKDSRDAVAGTSIKDHHPLPIARNPFSSERTIVSGFGSRSIQKTIFGLRGTLKKKIKSVTRIESDNIDETDENDLLPAMISPKMWVQRPKYANGSKEDDVLWILVKDESPSKGVDGDNDDHIVLKVTFDDETDDWIARRATRIEEENFVQDHPLDKWIPIEGLYGAYKVPSGVLWILIAGSEAVYEAPPISSSSSAGNKQSWWEIRRVTNLEIVHLGNKGYHQPEPSQLTIAQSKATLLRTSRLREEVRQIRLLRKALKQHDFYYVPKSSCTNDAESHKVVRDMTKSLQRSIVNANALEEGSNPVWWEQSDEDEEDESNLLPDSRFFWNQQAVEPILQRYNDNDFDDEEECQTKQLADLLLQNIVPLTSAFVGVQKNITVSDEKSSTGDISYDQILISRRSRFRAGTRFTVRGADAAGDCANFAETEQICLTSKGTGKNRCLRSVASHVQTRGSIPLRWSSPADVKTYRPRINIGADPLAQARAVKLHILNQLRYYAVKDEKDTTKTTRSPGVADIVFVNLVDKHSDQGRLGRAFNEVLRAVVDVHTSGPSRKEPNRSKRGAVSAKATPQIGSDSVEHVWYDFHAEVKNGRWDRLSILLDKIRPSLLSHGYFMARAPSENAEADAKHSKWTIERLQNAVVRTNCMDCLDRTNVVQSIFGRYMLFQQLSNEAKGIALESKNDKLWSSLNEAFEGTAMTLPWGVGEVAHRLLWADNADAISRLYAGTPALKGDFTRTGKRTKKGALDDGMNSLQRYYLNNFLDADRQEGYDLLVGHAAFSNVIDEDLIEAGEAESAEDSSNPFLSFLGASRGSLMNDVVQGSSYENREDVRKRLEEIGVSKQPDLDLRWLPGDLQRQVRGQASEASPNEESNHQQDGVPTPTTGTFSSQLAMKGIDERSHIELPWWTKSEEGWLEVDNNEDEGATNELASQHKSQAIVTPLQLAVVFYMGLKAPTALGGIALAILSFVYLPECIKNDYEQQKDLRGFFENTFGRGQDGEEELE